MSYFISKVTPNGLRLTRSPSPECMCKCDRACVWNCVFLVIPRLCRGGAETAGSHPRLTALECLIVCLCGSLYKQRPQRLDGKVDNVRFFFSVDSCHCCRSFCYKTAHPAVPVHTGAGCVWNAIGTGASAYAHLTGPYLPVLYNYTGFWSFGRVQLCRQI